MALTLADAVLRRLDLGTAGSPPEADLAVVVRVMAGDLGWSAEREQAERSGLLAALARWSPPEGAAPNPC
jgi:glycerol-3-phosphate dehydrogenase